MDVGNLESPGVSPPFSVPTVDDDLLLESDARTIARRYYIAGFFALPWFWATNIWLFLPHWGEDGDAVVKHYIRRSALWFVVYTCLLLPWTMTFWIDGPSLLGQSAYDALDVTKLDLAGAGFGGG